MFERLTRTAREKYCSTLLIGLVRDVCRDLLEDDEVARAP